jgi:hypothetical protein
MCNATVIKISHYTTYYHIDIAIYFVLDIMFQLFIVIADLVSSVTIICVIYYVWCYVADNDENAVFYQH